MATRELRALVLLVMLLPACRRTETHPIAAAEPVPITPNAIRQTAALRIQNLYPPSAIDGVPFKQQPEGASALGIAGGGFTRSIRVSFDGVPLQTNYQNPRAISIFIPRKLLSPARRVAIVVRDSEGPTGRSASATFEILPPPAAGTAPTIRNLYPPSISLARGGPWKEGFLELGVEGSDFGPQTVIVFDGAVLETSYQGPTALTARVPKRLIRAPGRIAVTARDHGRPGAPSAAVHFEVGP